MSILKQKIAATYLPIEVKAGNGFLTKLNDAFAELMRDTKFQKRILKEAEKNNGQTDDEILEEAFDRLYPLWMQDLESRGHFDGDHIIVYRAISALNFDAINLSKAGIYWTWDRKKANNYSNKNTKLPQFILKAEVGLSNIDIKATLSKIVWNGYEHEESEREITTKKGQKLTLLDVEDKEGIKVQTDADEVLT